MKNYDLQLKDSGTDAGKRTVCVVGCLDSHTVVAFEKSMNEIVDGGASHVTLDLSELNYISSAGISALMGLTHRLRRSSGDLVLVHPTEKVSRVFRTLGFSRIFTIIDSEAHNAQTSR